MRRTLLWHIEIIGLEYLYDLIERKGLLSVDETRETTIFYLFSGAHVARIEESPFADLTPQG